MTRPDRTIGPDGSLVAPQQPPPPSQSPEPPETAHASTAQVAVQPSPSVVLPSSHDSPGSTVPLPHSATFFSTTTQTLSIVQPPIDRPASLSSSNFSVSLPLAAAVETSTSWKRHSLSVC